MIFRGLTVSGGIAVFTDRGYFKRRLPAGANVRPIA
jgi:hypothetical protein